MSWSTRLSLLLVGTALVVAAYSFFTLSAAFNTNPLPFTECVDDYGVILQRGTAERPATAFDSCIRHHAQIYLATAYPEAKDLGKTFLTLLTAVLVASITFSEKIVDLSAATWPERVLMLTCWLALLGAIILSGIGIVYISTAAEIASYSPFLDYRGYDVAGLHRFVAAGVSFALALAALLVAGAISLVRRSARAEAGRAA